MRYFKPAVYSKFQTVAKLQKALEDAPMQQAGSKEAFAGKVFELVEGAGPVGCLDEIFEFAGCSELRIQAQDGLLTVKRQSDGTWKITGGVQSPQIKNW